MNSSVSKLIFYLFFFLTIATAGFFWGGRSHKRHDVSLGKVTRQDLVQRVTMAGTVVPYRKTIIAAPYSGYVRRIFVKVGDQVKQNDPLVSVVQSLQASENVFPIRAPFSGQVVQVQKSEGEFVKESDIQEFILRVDDLSKLFINAIAPEIDRVKIRLGHEAIVKASAITNRSYKAVIREMSLAARVKDDWSRSQVVDFPIKLEILDKDETIKPGMSVVIDVITDRKENVLTLRHEFIQREDDQYFVVRQNGQRQDIKVGVQNEEAFEIREGLTEGDLLKQVDFTEIK